MRLTEPHEIKNGMTVYAVHAVIGVIIDITKLIITSDAYIYKNGNIKTDVADVGNSKGTIFGKRLFLNDFNCGAHYNDHGLFTDKHEAKQYVEDFKNGILHSAMESAIQQSLF